jgi:hypothetical protein
MRAINQFIIYSGINKKLVCQTTIRNKLNDILTKKHLNHELNVTKQIAMGFDGRIDFTLNSKNRFYREEHLTFVDKAKLYIPTTIKTKNCIFAVEQKVQLNEYETVLHFLQLSQNLTWDCLLISVNLPVFTSFCMMCS